MTVVTSSDLEAMQQIDEGSKKLPEAIHWLDDKFSKAINILIAQDYVPREDFIRAINMMESKKAEADDVTAALIRISKQLDGQKAAIISMAEKLDADELAESTYKNDALAEMV